MTDYETLLVDEPAPGVVLVTLNRPERYNAMTLTMFDEFEHLARAQSDRDDSRVVILTGAGKAFCAGFDLEDAEVVPTLGPLQMLARQERAARSLVALRSMRVPLIAAVNGAAAGGGLSLALAADIILGSTEARFNAAFIKVGLSAGDLGASWLLTRLIGSSRAAEICFTGRMVESAEAHRIGLVNSLSEPEELIPDALRLADSIAANSPGGVQLSKRALQANLEVSSYAAALELENRGQALLTGSSDLAEALAAYKEHRPARFTGD